MIATTSLHSETMM